MTPLEKTLRRSLQIDRRAYVITLTPDVLKITEKGHRLGLELPWKDLVNGETALAVALHASIGRFERPRVSARPPNRAKKPSPKPKRASRSK